MKQYTRLSQAEREQIFLLLHEKVSIREIGQRLGRSHTTISREVRHTRESPYSPVSSHAHAVAKRHKSDQHKLDDPMLRTFVTRRLGDRWSPEQIAGRLKVIHARVTVSHETIYKTLYQYPLKHERLWEFLRRGHKKRERWFDRRTRHHKRGEIVGKVPISERPQEAQERTLVGHWETDLMEGTKASRHVVSATVDRKSGAIMLDKLTSKESQEKMDAMVRRLSHIPIHIRKTMTFDNGLENAQHRRLHDLRMLTYFCAAFHSWEIGTVENTIGLVREYLPKSMDLTHVSQQELIKNLWWSDHHSMIGQENDWGI